MWRSGLVHASWLSRIGLWLALLAPGMASAQDDTATSSSSAPVAARVPETGDRAPIVETALTDHASVVGRWSFGWFGASQIPSGNLGQYVLAPVLGVRHWTSEDVGLDLGLGIGLSVGGALDDGFAAMAHVGVPLAIFSGRHYTFVVVPEANLGFAVGEAGRAGLRVELGARAGAEIQFGFIGMPELALEASAGLYGSVRGAVAAFDWDFAYELTSTTLNEPWDFFRTAVAARYYF